MLEENQHAFEFEDLGGIAEHGNGLIYERSSYIYGIPDIEALEDRTFGERGGRLLVDGTAQLAGSAPCSNKRNSKRS